MVDAVGRRRAFGIRNHFGGALDVRALWAMAGWLYPAGTLETINRRFAAMPAEGAFWASL